MDALQELKLNRIARMQNIQKGENTFGFGSNLEDLVEKAHQVGEIKVGNDGIKRVWTQLPNGKYDWRRVKRDKNQQPTPQSKQAVSQQEPDFTSKIPKEISRLNSRSDWNDFEVAYRTLGADIIKEKYPTSADVQKYIQNNSFIGIKTQADMERQLGRIEAGDYVFRLKDKPLSKTNQIAEMKKYYEDKAERDKKAYQKKKNDDYWASNKGVKRKSEIKQGIQEQIAIRKKCINDAVSDIQKLLGNNSGYEIDVYLTDYEEYKLGIGVGKTSWTPVAFEVKKRFRSNDFDVEFNVNNSSYDFNDSNDIKQAQVVFHCGNIIVQNVNKIKEILIKHGTTYGSAREKIEKLNEELEANK